MNKHLNIILLLLQLPFIVFPQTVIRGIVHEKTNNQPIAGALINIIGENKELIAYDVSDDNGMFSISINKPDKNILVVCRMLGYKETQKFIENKSQEIPVFLEQSNIELKEVVIKSKPITVSEDTLIYSVNAFKRPGDGTIGDLLKKLPGIEVTETGGIKYNGENINKFYIEGLDLLSDKYGVATNNLPVDAVQNVEVIENHQPVKSLKGMVSSAQAAINIKLKDDKMLRPIGGVRAGGGYSNNINWLLEFFALNASKKSQSIAMYKTNNCGSNIGIEIADQAITLENGQNPAYGLLKHFITNTNSNFLPIEEERYLFNKTHTASLNKLWKTGKDAQLSLNVCYLNDTQKKDNYQESNYYYMKDSTLKIIETNSATRNQRAFDGTLTYTNNTTNYYIDNAFRCKVIYDENNYRINSNTDVVSQSTNFPSTLLYNQLKYILRREKHVLNFNSFMAYVHQPEHLTVSNNGNTESQNIGLSSFYTKNKSYYSWVRGQSSLQLDGEMEASLNNLNSQLANTTIIGNVSDYHSKINTISLTLTPRYAYETKKLKFEFKTPFKEHLLFKANHAQKSTTDKDFFSINPYISLFYSINPYIKSELSYNYKQDIGDYTDMVSTYFMNDYRNFYKSSGTIGIRKSQSFQLSVHYKNPMTTLFINASISFSPIERNKALAQQFVSTQLIMTDTLVKKKSDVWMGTLYVAKYFSSIRTNFSSSSNYYYYHSSQIQQGVSYPFGSGTLNLLFSSNTKINNSVNFTYKAIYTYNTTAIKTASQSRQSSINQIGQQITVYISPSKKVQLNTRLEHTYNELKNYSSVNMIFADVGLNLKLKKVEFDLNCNNIFDKKSYSYSIFSGLDKYSYRYYIRPISVLLVASFKL